MGAKRPPVPKICHTYLAMMKLVTVIPYPKKLQKIYQSRHTPAKFCWYQHFFTGNQHYLLYQEIHIYIAFWYIISNSLNFSWIFEKKFSKPVTKMATPDLFKITVFWNKDYGVIITVDDVTNKILSRDSNYIVNLFKWPKFGNSSISMREVITTSIL